MVSLLNPPWHEALSFTDDVKAVLNEKSYIQFRCILERANHRSLFLVNEIELVVSFLKGHKELLIRFNIFLLDGEIAYYRDQNGQDQIMVMYPDECVAYDYQCSEEPSPTEKAVAVAQLFGATCHEWDKSEKDLVTAVVGGEKTAIEDLDRAVDIVTKGKSNQETEQLVNLLGKTLPDRDKGIIGVWSKLPDLVEKKLALWTSDSPHGWTFYVLEKEPDSRKRKAENTFVPAKVESS